MVGNRVQVIGNWPPFKYGAVFDPAEHQMRPQNVQAGINQGRLQVVSTDMPPARKMDRHLAHRGGGRYDIIEGFKINDEPLDKESAERLLED